MEAVPPPSDEAPRAAASCSACRASTAADQRYCLACGALVGDRRLDPIEMLTPATAAGPLGGPPPSGPAAAPRAVPLAAATAAIVVAGISGMLVTQGGSGNGARAAVVAAAPAAAAPAPEAPPVSDDAAADTDPVPADEDPLPADPLPADPPPAEPEAIPDEPISDDAPADEDTGEDEDAADDEPVESTPRVWLLALEGPQAADAVARIAKQGVRLSEMQSFATSTQANATALVSGTRPTAVDPAAPVDPVDPVDPAAVPAPAADGTATDVAPSLPAALTAAQRTWRAYVDVQPATSSVLPGACAAPAAGDPAATLLSSRLPFAAIPEIGCDKAVTSLEALGNDLSAGEDIPAFSYVAMGGCAAPERTAVALPDAVEDAVATITSSTEYQQDGMLVVTTVGTQDACTPAAPAPVDPAAPPVPPAPAADPAAAPVAPTAVLRPEATAGRTVEAKLDLLALSRSMAEVLGVTPPGSAGDGAVPALALPGVPKKTD